MLSLSLQVLPVVELALFEILHIRNWHRTIPTDESKVAAENSLMQVLRDSTLYCCFMSSDLASARK